jgi:hypothetical protein
MAPTGLRDAGGMIATQVPHTWFNISENRVPAYHGVSGWRTVL